MAKTLTTAILVLGFTACSTTTYRYVPDKPLTYTRQVNGKPQAYKLDPLYHDLEKSGKISVYFIFRESQENWPDLAAIEISLYDGDLQIPLKKSKLTVSYWDGKIRPEIQKDNFTGSLYELFPESLIGYKYNSSMSAAFTYELEYATEKFPDTLRQKITLRFRDKILTFENNLKKQKFERAFISGRPFG